MKVEDAQCADATVAPDTIGAREGARAKLMVASGIFLLVLAIYGVSAPGRIDIIDGQMRYDVAFNLVTAGHPVVTDPWVGPLMGVRGRNGHRYSFYGAPASVFATPLIWLGLNRGAGSIEASQFLFSLTSSVFGAGLAALLFLFYLELGLSVRRALAWTVVSSFATYMWPISNSTFDNAQHAFFAFAALYFAFLSSRRKSIAFAAVAGTMAGVLYLYQEYFVLIIPVIALATITWRPAYAPFKLEGRLLSSSSLWLPLDRMLKRVVATVRSGWAGPGEDRSSWLRYCVFVAGVSLGILAALAYNHLRFGSWFSNGKLAKPYPPLLGNPVAGFLTLTVSPGKSILLYSPTLILGIFGFRSFRRNFLWLATLIAVASTILVLFLSFILCAAGDWCWGPRYLTSILPMWSLALPFSLDGKGRRRFAAALILLGFVVQLLAISTENQRFFFERRLNDYFWAQDRWFYMKHSALFARVAEARSLLDGPPATARVFNSIPAPDWTTYSLLGPPPKVPRASAPEWIRNFQIYFLPRPWPLWMSSIPAAIRPIDVRAGITRMLCILAAGCCFIFVGLSRTKQVSGDSSPPAPAQ